MKSLYFKILSKTQCGYINPQKDRIYMIGVKTDNVKILVGEESRIIRDFVDIFTSYDPDRIIGFKQDYDDFPFLEERAKKYGISLDLGRDGSPIKSSGKYFRGLILKETKIEGRENIDLFAIAWRDFPRLPTKEIDELAGALEIKGCRVIPQFRIAEKKDKELVEYLENYLEILEKITDSIIPFEESISEICEVPLDRQIRMTVGELIDTIVVREMKKRGIKEMRIGGKGKYEGGYVWLKAPGVYENVVYLDFQSMYPSIIKVWNISPETVDMGDGEWVEIEGVKHRVNKEKRGVIPQLVDNFLKERLSIKEKLKKKYSKKMDAQQKALKVMANAMYGYMGWSGATYYNRNAAELIAALARYYIKGVHRLIEEMGGNVIYVDTDGIQFTGGDWDDIMERINSEFPLNIELERIVDRAAYWTKKKYAHLFQDKVVAVGIEYVRRDYPPLIKEAQRKIVESLLREDVEEARRIRSEYRKKLKNGEFNVEEIAVVEQLTKKPEEYEKATKASVVAKILKEKYGVDVHRGTYLYIAIVKGSGGPTFRARPIEMVSPKDIDISYYLKMYDDTINRTFEIFNVSPVKQWF
ncbi:hypothetical protein B6U71_04550 [Euryarchaeota archaeon ex4484_178]|nr:MAG: hypothetical protein B6U71_04550 [Euryarchaeota archaeon ex4484_178]